MRLRTAALLTAPLLLLGGLVAVPVLAVAAAPPPSADTSCTSTPAQPVGAPAEVPQGDAVMVAAQAAYAAGWRGEDLVMAVAIAGAESGYRPDVRNSIGASGLWQVFQPAHPQFAEQWRTGSWKDPMENARMAFSVWSDAGSWRPWTTFTGADTPGGIPTWPRYEAAARTAVEQVLQAAPPAPAGAVTEPVAAVEQGDGCVPDEAAGPGAGDVNVQCETGGGSVVQVPVGPAIRSCSVNGLLVDSTVAERTAAMLAAAAADGIILGGSGGRTVERQWELRRQNCGSGWNTQGSRCSPPTGWPTGAGASRHLFHRALDLTCNGSLIRSRQSPCFLWLASNGAAYGYKNLPSEPWHWSDTGT